jgi:hypothetical protein
VTNDLSSYEDFSLTADSQTMVAIQREYSWVSGLLRTMTFQARSVSIQRRLRTTENAVIAWTKDGKLVFVSSEGGRRTYGEWTRTAATQSR